ncbi:MAG: (2Fe-2S) ferredoxin domain-containing protein [Rhodospirillales bacterium]|jgi:(2Fe-2S) ferredoxin|nr:(2Fe-2S) ferredoxin domain-containing protein [Rhodospirillales bacterium]
MSDADGLAPFYDNHVFVCMNERPEGHERGSCARKGAVQLRNYMKARVKELGIEKTRINQAGCLDRCELGPTIVIYPEGIWYRAENAEDIDEIISEHLQNGRPVERLMLHPED